MKKSYTVRRLDRRYNGGDHFQHRVEISDSLKNPDKADLYRRMRQWCQDTWGASVEVRHHRMFRHNGFGYNDHWCYDNGWYHSYYLYLKGDQELMLFDLRW